MSITIVVDANIILSALLGGKSGSILFDKSVLKKHITHSPPLTKGRLGGVLNRWTILNLPLPLLRKEGRIDFFNTLLELLPLQRYQRSTYKPAVQEAEDMIGGIDTKDVDILALALWLQAYLWSQDRHFEKAGYDKLLKTHDLMG